MTGPNFIPVWDGIHTLPLPQTQESPDLPNWTTGVTLDLPADGQQQPCTFASPQGQNLPTKIPLGCFYAIPANHPATQKQCYEVAAASRNARQIGPDVSTQGCYFILMGFNISAKVPRTDAGDAWTWQTYWWSARALDPSNTEDYPRRMQPLPTDGRWQHYVMETTTPATGGSSKYLFNPYLEGVMVGDTTSTCMDCHQRATFRTAIPPNPNLIHCLFFQQSNVNPRSRDCSELQQSETANRLGTDNVWSLANVNVALAHGIAPPQ